MKKQLENNVHGKILEFHTAKKKEEKSPKPSSRFELFFFLQIYYNLNFCSPGVRQVPEGS